MKKMMFSFVLMLTTIALSAQQHVELVTDLFTVYSTKPHAKYEEADQKILKKIKTQQIGSFKHLETLQMLDLSACDASVKAEVKKIDQSLFSGYNIDSHRINDEGEIYVLTKKVAGQYIEFVILDTRAYYFTRLTGKFTSQEIDDLIDSGKEKQ